jgi:hypothetical protein
MATLDQIRLQQLLSPFQNQNTGIINTTSASPFINTADILNQYNVPNIQNQNLVDEIISQNIQKNMGNFINAPQDYYPGGINAGLGVLTKNNDEEDEDQVSYLGINNMTYGTPRTIADQNAVLGRTFTQQPKSFRDSATLQEYLQNRNPITGIMNLFRNIPTPFKLGLGALKGISSALQNTTFGRSKTLAEYFDRKSRIKNAKRMAEKYEEFGERDSSDRGKGMESASAVGGVYGGGAGGLHSGE